MSNVSSAVEIFLQITREVRSRKTHKRKHTQLSVRLLRTNQTLFTQPAVAYTQITKQNSYAPTNIE
jgi:hypothetical protein